jgi:hypothetical protein
MNKEILVAMKWLDNMTLITQEELEEAYKRAEAADDEAHLIAEALQDDEDAYNRAVDKEQITYCVKRVTRAAERGRQRGANAWLGVYFSLYSTITKQTYLNCIKFGSSNVPETG